MDKGPLKINRKIILEILLAMIGAAIADLPNFQHTQRNRALPYLLFGLAVMPGPSFGQSLRPRPK